MVLMASGCTSGDDHPSVEAPAVSGTETVPTTATTTVSAQAAPTVTLLPESSKVDGRSSFFNGWASGVYQSPGYSCGPDPTQGCPGSPYAVRMVWYGSEGDDSHPGLDFIDFWSNATIGGDPVSPERQAELGLGVRIVPLERDDLPAGAPSVTGAAFLEVTVSGMSAVNGVSPRVPFEDATVMTGMALMSTTDDMMQWIVGLRNPGHHLYDVVFWEQGSPGLQIFIAEGSDDASGDYIITNAYASGAYQSPGYTCGLDPTTGCGDGAVRRLTKTRFFGGDAGHDVDGVGCMRIDLAGGGSQGAGYGVRIVQLTEPPQLPPDVEPIAGKAWLEITVSDASAIDSDTASQPKPHRVTAEPDVNHITEMMLIETTDDMIRWIVGLDEPGLYEYQPLLNSGPGLWIHIRKAV
jgi:hypothetical protein